MVGEGTCSEPPKLASSFRGTLALLPFPRGNIFNVEPRFASLSVLDGRTTDGRPYGRNRVFIVGACIARPHPRGWDFAVGRGQEMFASQT